MKILGIDVGGAYCTAFFLDSKPENPKEFCQSKDFQPFKVTYTEDDLNGLLKLEPDLVCLEPTGYHYEQLLVEWLDKHGAPWKKVVGQRMANYRKSLGLPKTDGRDAFAIALYGLEFYNDRHAFTAPCQLPELRRLWIERNNITSMRGSLVNRLRQLLCHQFPEVANKDLDRKWGHPCPALIRWMAGDDSLYISQANKYRNLHYAGRWKTPGNGSYTTTTGTIGSGIGEYAKMLARQILEIDRMALEHEARMEEWMNQGHYARYIEAMADLGFSKNLMAVWMTRIYPIERFLDEDGRPINTKRLSGRGKWVTHHISLGRFKAALGAGLTPNTSGIKGEIKTRYYKRQKSGEVEKFPLGDKLARKAFVLWGARVLECGTLKQEGEGAKKLMEKHAELKAKGTKRYQRLSNLHGYAARLLFKSLTN